MKKTNEIAQEALNELWRHGYISRIENFPQMSVIITKAIEEAQVRGEIVLWQVFQHGEWEWCKEDELETYRNCGMKVRPLYTTPPKRQPLTDQEITSMMPDRISSQHDGDLMDFARAIEVAINGGGA